MKTLNTNLLKKSLLALFISAMGGIAQAQLAQGQLVVTGDAGPSQLFAQVKAQRCERMLRKCDAPVYFNLNEAALVNVGTYLVGFENSIYPGFVTVGPGFLTTLPLQRLDIPAPLNSATEVRVFRDFSSPVELNKQLATQFYVGRPFFHLGAYGFGDLYLASSIQKSVTSRLSYDACSKVSATSGGDPDVLEVINLCKAYMSATSPSQLAPFFQALGVESDTHITKRDSEKVDNRGKLRQIWVTGQNMKVEVQLERHLVSAPMRGSDYVAVFPGVYRIMAPSVSSATTQVTVGPINQAGF